MSKKFISGALPDTRTDEAKSRDYSVEEIATATAVE